MTAGPRLAQIPGDGEVRHNGPHKYVSRVAGRVLPSWVDRPERDGLLRGGYYAVVAAYLVSWVVLARSYRPDARLLPTVLGVALLALLCLRGAGAVFGGEGGGALSAYAPDDGPAVDARRATVAFGWLAVLVTAVVVVGLVPGIGVVVAGFVARYDRPRRAVLVGPATALAVYLLFVLLLELPTYEPVAVRVVRGVVGG